MLQASARRVVSDLPILHHSSGRCTSDKGSYVTLHPHKADPFIQFQDWTRLRAF
jgi:hypothetical protein